MLPIVIKVLLVIHVIVSLLIILLVLMQRPKNEGLGAAFGGGATDQLFGAQTTNVLQTITRWLGGIFFSLTLLLSILYVKQGGGRSSVQDKLTAPTVIPALPTPAPALTPGATPGAENSSVPKTPAAPGAENANVPKTPKDLENAPAPLDGKEPMKLELGPGQPTPPAQPGEAVSEPVKPAAPAPAPAPAPEKAAEPAAPAPAPENKPAESKPAEPKPAEPAPEPKPAEPAK